MIENLDSVKKQLAELASVLNAFKSEAVQLRLLDFILSDQTAKVPGKAPKQPAVQQPTAQQPAAQQPAAQQPAAATTPKPARAAAPAAEVKAVKRGRKAASGSGANATLTQLLATPFFDSPRTLNDIIRYCKENMSRPFKANEFSGKLGTLVRRGELTRQKNAANQFEYKKA